MKKIILKHLIIVVCSLLTIGSFSQEKISEQMKTEAAKEYKAIKNPEISFENYLVMKQNQSKRAAFFSINPNARYVSNATCNNNTPCGNGDFESGLDPNNWGGAFGEGGSSNPTTDAISPATGLIYFENLTTGFNSGNGTYSDPDAHQTIVNASDGLDPITNILTRVAPVGGSTKALRLGNTATGNGVELLTKSFTVTQSNSSFIFWFATVFENPAGHTPPFQPTFFVRVINCNTGQPITGVVNLGVGNTISGPDSLISNSQNPFFHTIPNPDGTTDSIVYHDWSCAQINLSQYIGIPVVIEFVNKDCAFTGHYGYTYLDNFCGNCDGSPTGNLKFNDTISSTCGAGDICFAYDLPKAGTLTGNINIKLSLYQNGIKVKEIQSGSLSSGNQYCFRIDPYSNVLGINTNLSGFDFSAEADFSITGTNGVVTQLGTLYAGGAPSGQDNTLNNDYAVNCKQCCPGKNLILNGSFELDNVAPNNFLPVINYQPTVALSSVVPGKYGLLSSAQALAVSPTWDPGCSNYKRHLVVNGFTGRPSVIIWSKVVTLVRGKTYKFCADFKNMDQCGFNVKPRITVLFNNLPAFNIPYTTINAGAGCNWQTLMKEYTIPAGLPLTPTTISIYLDQTGQGDGNDVAVDNINLVEEPKVDVSQLLFNLAFSHISNNSFNIAATPVAPLNGCTEFWQVEQLSTTYTIVTGTQVINPPLWLTTTPNVFTNYVGTSTLAATGNPGIFTLSKRYRIIYGRTCQCTVKNIYAVIVDPFVNKGGKPGVHYYEDKEYMQQLNSGTDEYIVKTNALSEDKNSRPSLPNENAIKVFPNPTNTAVTISTPNLENNSYAKLYDVFGHLIKTIPIQAKQNNTFLQMESYPTGTYMLQIISSTGKIIYKDKIIKQL